MIPRVGELEPVKHLFVDTHFTGKEKEQGMDCGCGIEVGLGQYAGGAAWGHEGQSLEINIKAKN